MTGVRPEQLDNAGTLPAMAIDTWRTFLDMHRRRGVIPGGMGPSLPARISYADIDAYCRVTSRRFEPWELDCIEAADDAYMASVATK